MALQLQLVFILGCVVLGTVAVIDTCSQCADIVAFVDSSADISMAQFTAVQDKLKEITNDFEIGTASDEAQVAVVTFAKFIGYNIEFGSTNTSSSSALIDSIDALERRGNGGSLRVRLAIDEIPERILDVSNRPGCEDICVIFVADMIDFFPVGFKEEIQTLQNRCKVYAVDAGNAPEETLQQLASNDAFVYNSLDSFSFQQICPAACPNCADIVVLADATADTTNAVFDDLQDLLLKFESTPHFQISPTETRVSVVKFGKFVSTYGFNDMRASNPSAYLAGVNALTKDTEEVSEKVRLAMQRAIEDVLPGARAGCDKVCVVTISGSFFFTQGMRDQIDDFLANCDQTIAVGLTSAADPEFLQYFEDNEGIAISVNPGESASSKFSEIKSEICDEPAP